MKKKKFIGPYCIQRGNFRPAIEESKSDLDRILEFQYMGSAEFEFGALPQSLKRIRENIEEYMYCEFSLRDKVITAFFPDRWFHEVEDTLQKLSEHKLKLKEHSDFDTWIRPSDFFKNRTDFWWDIENDWMFWKHNLVFSDQFSKLIVSREPKALDKLNHEELSTLSTAVQTSLRENKSWRAGQALFNCLYEMRPELANSIRGTTADPFYANDRIGKFFREICDDTAIKYVNPSFLQNYGV